jgi:heterodisulfide reductase subunit C
MPETKKQIIYLEELDKGMVEAVIKAGGDKINVCIQCGTCSASCPSGRRTAFRTRQIMRKALLGLKNEVLQDPDLWLCTTCYTCLERCPRGVDPTDVILILRRMAVKEGHMLDKHRNVASLVLTYGHAVPINDATKEIRRNLGLTEIPPTTHMFKDALLEIQTIARKTKFDELIGQKPST